MAYRGLLDPSYPQGSLLLRRRTVPGRACRPAEFYRVCVLVLAGCLVRHFSEKEASCRPDPAPPATLAGAVTLGFMVRGVFELHRAVIG